jgi:hypothetical protein
MNRAPRSIRNPSRSLLALLGVAAIVLAVGCTNGGGGATTQPAGAPAASAPAPSAPAAQPSAAGGYNY